MKSKEELLKRKKEILDFLSKHYQKDPEKLNNFITKYPNYDDTDLALDPSSEANEFADYEVALETEHALENELMDIEEQLAKMEE